MKTFKQFVAEKWIRGVGIGSGSKKRTRKWGITHTDQVAGHDVEVSITHLHRSMNDPKRKGHVAVNFAVDGSDEKEDMRSKDGAKILHHVHKVVKHYIEKRKPKEIRMLGNTKQKQDVYSQYAHRLAKHFNGSVRKEKSKVGLGNIHILKTKSAKEK